MKKKALTFLLTSMLAALAATAQVLPGRRISLTDGLASNIVHVMAQDSAGYIWMGTASGLCRYDGYRFVVADGLSVPNIGSIAIDDRHGLVWVRTSSFDYQCYVVSEGRFAAYEDSIDANRQFRNHQLASDAIWVYDQDRGARCLCYESGRIKAVDFTTANGQLPSNRVEKILIDPEQRACIVTREGIVVASSDGTGVKLLSGQRIMAATLDANGGINAVTGDGLLHCFDVGLHEERTLNIGRDVSLQLKDPKVDFVLNKKDWMLFTSRGSFVLSLTDGRLEKPETIQLPSPQALTRVDDYYVVSSTRGSLLLLSGDGRQAVRMTLTEQGNIRRILPARSADGRFFFATQDDGLYVYDPQTGQIGHYTQDDRQPVVYANKLNSILRTRDGTVLVACDMAGIVILPPRSVSQAVYLLPDPQNEGSPSNMIRYLKWLSADTLLLSTRHNEVFKMSIPDMKFTLLAKTKACVYAYQRDGQGREWVGTRSDGLYIDGVHYSRSDSAKYIPTDNIYAFTEDEFGQMWIAGYDGGLLLATSSGDHQFEFRQVLSGSGQLFYAKQIATDGRGRLWVATSEGLYTTSTAEWQHGRQGRFIRFCRAEGSLPIDDVMCLAVDHAGNVWIAGHTNGLFRCHYNPELQTLETVNITMKQGLVNNNVRSIVEADDGNIWVGTEEGMSRVNPKTMTAGIFLPNGDLAAVVCAENAICKTDGRILFGTNRGIAILPTAVVDKLVPESAPVITDLRVNGRSVYEDETLRSLIGTFQKGTVRLAHNQNSLDIFFSMLSFSNTLPQHFMYQLEGLEADWHSLTDQSHAQYNALRPGKYTFRVKAINSSGGWGDECYLTIIVSQPWWNMWWAWCCYVALALAITAALLAQWWRNFRLHEQMTMERQMTEFRLDFFTHIAHEFRTPLALVQGAVDSLVSPQDQTIRKTSLQTAQRGTRRLLKLVNQLMEFRKINTGNLHLQVERGDIVAFVRDIYRDFWNVAKEKELAMTFTPFTNSHLMFFDQHMTETIVYNLLSNAVKYTPQKGRVAVGLNILEDEHSTWLQIQVNDSGSGISHDQEQRLFQPFMHGYVSAGGMGIGLYTAHKMAETHHGRLTYKAAVGGGSSFTSLLPTDETLYRTDEFKVLQATRESPPELVTEIMEPSAPPLNPQTVAIVEDDADMMHQLRMEVGAYFNVVTFMDGNSAIAGITEQQPDVLVSDVMLPDIDGYEMVRQLRKKGAQMPVMMLTALDDDEHQLRAYRAGADDYMSKPCNISILIARIMKLVEWNNNRQPGGNDDRSESSPALLKAQADKIFIERVQSIIAAHIGDESFTIDTLASAMSMGRSKFYGKMKDLLDMSPNTYLMKQRMRKAAELIMEGELSISEIGYRVGISNTSYFFKCFKKEFGVTPGKYGR